VILGCPSGQISPSVNSQASLCCSSYSIGDSYQTLSELDKYDVFNFIRYEFEKALKVIVSF